MLLSPDGISADFQTPCRGGSVHAFFHQRTQFEISPISSKVFCGINPVWFAYFFSSKLIGIAIAEQRSFLFERDLRALHGQYQLTDKHI